MIPAKKTFLKIIVCVMILALTTPCFAAEKFINYQGELTDSAGLPVNGPVTIIFSIWNDPVDSNPTYWIWGESQELSVNEGIFNARLGNVNPLAGVVDFAESVLYLEVSVNGTILGPRTQLTQVPAAFWADEADTLDGLDSSDFAEKADLLTGGSGVKVSWDNLADIPAGFADGVDDVGGRNTLDAADGSPPEAVFVDNNGNVGIGTTTPEKKLHIRDGGLLLQSESGEFLELQFQDDDTGVLWSIQGYDGLHLKTNGVPRMSFWDNGHIEIGSNTNGASLDIRGTGNTHDSINFYIENNNRYPMFSVTDTARVGIGTKSPTTTLDVRGSIAVNGLVDGRDIAGDGAVLDSLVFGGGTDTTNDAWTGTTDVYTTAGNVAIGTSNADGYKLNALGHSDGKAAVRGLDFERVGDYPLQLSLTYAEGRLGSFNPAGLPTTLGHIGVLGRKTSQGDSGVGVYAWNNDDDLTNIAMYAVADGTPPTNGSNYGVYAVASNGSSGLGTNYGIYAKAENGPTNYAGYFDGDVETIGNIHAAGDITADGTIQVTGEFTAGSITSTGIIQGTRLSIDTSMDKAVTGVSTDYRGMGGYFTTTGTIGKGIYGAALSEQVNDENYGGHFESAGGKGRGVYGSASGTTGYGGYFSATGDWGTGIYAEGTGMETSYAAVFKGNVQLLSKNTGEPILELGEGLDYAEGFDVSDEDKITAGTVLVIDPDTPGKLKICDEDYDLKVAGVVAGAKGLGSGVRLGAGQFDHDVALAGRVYCNVEAGNDGIKPGEQLTTSRTPGYAMKADDHDRSRGAILGKAMEPLAAGESGQILILVTLQ